MAVKLTERLLAAASLVRGGGSLADIGTDHAYLPVWLIENNVIERAIASDIGKMPLENAKKTVSSYGLNDRIELRLSDGLASFDENDADEFVFAGMGGTLIASLMEKTPWVKNERFHFVFQPQSRAEELREYLFDNGFEICTETAVHEGERFYIAFDAVYTGVVREYEKHELFLGKLPKTPDAKSFISRQYSRLEKKYRAIKDSEDGSELKNVLDELENFLNV